MSTLSTAPTPQPSKSEAKIVFIPGLLEMLPITGVKLQNISDPYADQSSWPLDEKGKAGLTQAIQADYQNWAGRAAIDKTLAAITETIGNVGRAGAEVSPTVQGELMQLHETLAAQAQLFESKGRPLVGVSDLKVVDGVLEGSSYPVPAVRYQKYAKVGERQEVLAFASVVGTSAVLVAKDQNGKSWIQVQARNEIKNFPHGGNLGCSPAGLLRHNPSLPGTSPLQRLQAHLDGDAYTFKDIGSPDIKINLAGEGREEIGLLGPQLVDHKIIGLAFDHTSPHYEILNVLYSKLSRNDMTELGINRIREVAEQSSKHPHDFAETFAWIPADSETIKEFVKLAITGPATHTANFLAFAADLVRAESGDTAAKAWLDRTDKEMQTAWIQTSDAVRDFYLDQPSAFLLNMHDREQAAFAKFVSSKEVDDTATLRSQVNSEGLAQGYLRLALESGVSQDKERELVIAALAMQENIIHTPAADRFDPRRLPSKQGLKDPVTILKEMESKGIEIDWGTIPVRVK